MSELLAGFVKKNCATPGGIHSIVVYNIENRDTLTFAAGAITALTLASTKQAFEIIPDIEMTGSTQNRVRNRENNAYQVDQTVLCKVSGDTIALTDVLDQLGPGFYGVITRRATEDGTTFNNRHYGLLNGMVTETIDGVVGQTFDEGLSDTINFVGKEIGSAPTIDDATIATMLIPAP